MPELYSSCAWQPDLSPSLSIWQLSADAPVGSALKGPFRAKKENCDLQCEQSTSTPKTSRPDLTGPGEPARLQVSVTNPKSCADIRGQF